ncbi:MULTISPECIES: hypothetical protein [Nostocales]|uniref:Uncharacterized protein n=3 Tax=Nostocales TaxID=1161 RepID=A0A0C1NE85_9CYAN|nr:hypothetical protein [Tolypothrix bouteillei]KAF3887141.1 hypothetical protein DA73_0400017835 [Tolypothrix bouteillei VB521301]
MNQTDDTPTPKTLEIWQALDEIDKDPCIGRIANEEKDTFFDKFFSQEAKMQRLKRIRQRKQTLEENLALLVAMEKKIVESLQ